ncbi:unnamed protein product [Thelazia callipaeda]|uniref:Protein rogdi n=1 Tax=Thelazia callipaeda TaxID=103827 RepID=A0A0N5D986_THECL|nr:unnamed protein product [Thelazia callipaeda]
MATTLQVNADDDYEDAVIGTSSSDVNGHDDINNTKSKDQRVFVVQRSLLDEQQWYQKLEAVQMFEKIENILHEVCDRMNLTSKIDPTLKKGAPTTEKLSLVQRTGTEVFKCSIILFGESILQTEVTLKYPKMSGGVYRASAQPDVQWKLQQLQDADNYCIRALRTVSRGLRWIKNTKPANDAEKVSSTIVDICSQVTNLIVQARSTLCMPKKRTLLELCNSPITRCFNPPLPPDLVFSHYISSNRIVCAAYQVTSKANGVQGLTVTLADCFLPQLEDVLLLTDRALNIGQKFSHHMCMLRERIHAYNCI